MPRVSSFRDPIRKQKLRNKPRMSAVIEGSIFFCPERRKPPAFMLSKRFPIQSEIRLFCSAGGVPDLQQTGVAAPKCVARSSGARSPPWPSEEEVQTEQSPGCSRVLLPVVARPRMLAQPAGILETAPHGWDSARRYRLRVGSLPPPAALVVVLERP